MLCEQRKLCLQNYSSVKAVTSEKNPESASLKQKAFLTLTNTTTIYKLHILHNLVSIICNIQSTLTHITDTQVSVSCRVTESQNLIVKLRKFSIHLEIRH